MFRRPLLLALTLVAVSLAVGSPVALAGGGNSENAKLCQKNNWTSLQSSTGSGFTGQSECVSYGASGGALFGPRLTATDNGCQVPRLEGFDVWTLSATGFTPDSSLIVNDTPLPFPHFQFDSSGSITTLFVPDFPGVAITVTFTDGNGVHASVTFTSTTICNT
jgi:hypothetical protein